VRALWQDLRYGLRILAKAPSFTTIAILTLALGIGANTAIFSVVNSSLLRPLPFADSSQLVDLWGNTSMFDFPDLGLSLPDIQDLRAQNTAFSGIALYQYSGMTLTGTGAPRALDGVKVSTDLFPILGMKTLHGRTFTSDDMQPGQDREVILSFSLWQTQFGGDLHEVGKTVTLDGKSYRVVGVMGPQQHLDYVSDREFWTPLAPSSEERSARNDHGFSAIARLRRGYTVPRVQAQLDAIAARLAKTYPDADKTWTFRVVSVASDLLGDARLPMLMLLIAVGCVLLIACANVANLCLSRGLARRRELAIRSTLGATRGRVLRQLLVESLAIALMGGICGFFLAVWGVESLRALLPPETPRLKDLSVDQTVLWFTLAVSVLAGILSGLAPAVLASRQELNAAMKQAGTGSQGAAPKLQHSLLRRSLIVGEIAIAFLLVVGAGLALRSFAHLRKVNVGFRPDHLLTMTVDFPRGEFTKPEQSAAYVRDIIRRARPAAGVESVSASLYAPLSGLKGESTVHTDTTPQASPSVSTEANSITPLYFETFGIPLIAGRVFTEADTNGAPEVYIVNQAFAQKFFGHANPVGRRMWTTTDAKHGPNWGEIVGEVGDIRDQATKEAPEPEFFAPYYQVKQFAGVSLAIRTKADPLRVVSAVQDRIWSIDKAQPIEEVRTMDQLVANSNAAPRFQTLLLTIFGALGLVLAVVGIYGVISYSVTQRTHEIGIRMTLGAEPGEVMRLVLTQVLKVAPLGVAIGWAASLALTRLMSSLLFDVSATDLPTFLGVAIILLWVSLAASYLPARRAMRVDPMVALRHE
jgi:putative ABC transport system permease protein